MDERELASPDRVEHADERAFAALQHARVVAKFGEGYLHLMIVSALRKKSRRNQCNAGNLVKHKKVLSEYERLDRAS
jgi:hypothetical protein